MRSRSVPDTLSTEERIRRAEAARWVSRLHADDCTDVERAACKRWHAADPANAIAYAQMRSIHQRSAEFGLDPGRRAFANALRALSAQRAHRRQAWRWGLGFGMAAMLVLAVGVGWRTWDPAQPERDYASAVGEQRTVELDDGSKLLLDTDSEVRVRYSRLHRNVVLERGRAQFTVAKATDRPFLVQAGMATVRAVGTQFQVSRQADQVRVALLEGVVEVTPTSSDENGKPPAVEMHAGDQVSIDAHGAWHESALDRGVAEGWTRGELVFKETPLSQLVGEMNRYSRVKLQLGSPGLDDIRVSGIFYGGDQDSLIEALKQVWSLRAERKGDEIVIRR
jgi:transmembrane sensor